MSPLRGQQAMYIAAVISLIEAFVQISNSSDIQKILTASGLLLHDYVEYFSFVFHRFWFLLLPAFTVSSLE